MHLMKTKTDSKFEKQQKRPERKFMARETRRRRTKRDEEEPAHQCACSRVRPLASQLPLMWFCCRLDSLFS